MLVRVLSVHAARAHVAPPPPHAASTPDRLAALLPGPRAAEGAPAAPAHKRTERTHGLFILSAGTTTGDSGGELSSGDDSGDVESLPSPESGASRSLAELFEKAAAHLQSLVHVASREQLLYLYARYKQAKVGNCNTPKPGFFDFEGKQKWEAWKALGDSSPSQAMQEYIAAVKKLDPGWNTQLVAV
ncbi:hypothetical protein QTO34_011448 [Cnephaeus nilssonii]|uniref:Acyl-CoA-binding domain-containing protein 6 n=1 Tax=Cnephaeus nilssonii TaxID=3371016 RepID=A0AA40LEI4_CNENI|nr:hypothetical protein QTO34_011448 [Eptesicus nilssonii]